MPLSFWFWLVAFLAILGIVAGTVGSSGPRTWGWMGWGASLLLVWIELLLLGWSQFGGPLK